MVTVCLAILFISQYSAASISIKFVKLETASLGDLQVYTNNPRASSSLMTTVNNYYLLLPMVKVKFDALCESFLDHQKVICTHVYYMQ